MLKESGPCNSSTYQSRLEALLTDIKGREKEVVFFFDEVHTLLTDSPADRFGQLGQKLKTIIDTNRIFCIAATTREEYEDTIAKDVALNSRFKIINVEELSREDSARALNDIMLYAFPSIPVEEEAIETVLELSDQDKTVAQPRKGKKLLIEAAQLVSQYRGKELDELAKVEDELNRTRQQMTQTGSLFDTHQHHTRDFAQLHQLEAEKKRLKKRIDEINRQFTALHKTTLSAKKWQQRYINLAHQVAKKSTKPLLREMTLIAKYIIPALANATQQRIAHLAEKNIQTTITPQLIKQLYETD